jgi:chemotaxis protein MotB
MPPQSRSNELPLVVRKKQRRKYVHPHFSAWKVAYADLVTAMMAFFLLLWLLNVTTSDQPARHCRLLQPLERVAPD